MIVCKPMASVYLLYVDDSQKCISFSHFYSNFVSIFPITNSYLHFCNFRNLPTEYLNWPSPTLPLPQCPPFPSTVNPSWCKDYYVISNSSLCLTPYTQYEAHFPRSSVTINLESQHFSTSPPDCGWAHYFVLLSASNLVISLPIPTLTLLEIIYSAIAEWPW